MFHHWFYTASRDVVFLLGYFFGIGATLLVLWFINWDEKHYG